MMEEKLRYERKFPVWGLEAGDLKHLIMQNPFIFSEIFYERRVNNIYFDSPDLQNYRDNLGGVAERLKIRIRWYGKIFGFIKNPVLEIKIKKGFLGRKVSFKIKSFVLDKNLSHDFLQKEIFEKSNLPPWILEMLRLSRPVLLNSYKRKYFRSANKKYRATIDRDMVFFRLRNKNNAFRDKIFEKDLKIIELKYPKDCDDEISYITQEFPFRISAMSKYVYGIDILDL